jgi:ribosomal protein L37AE/L43A
MSLNGILNIYFYILYTMSCPICKRGIDSRTMKVNRFGLWFHSACFYQFANNDYLENTDPIPSYITYVRRLFNGA